MPSQLDLSNPIVTKDGRATAYLEDIIFQLFLAANPLPVEVQIVSGVATVDLTTGGQFSIVAASNFVIDVIGVEGRVDNDNYIDIQNPAGAFDLTNITAPAGVAIQKQAGSTISILGGDYFVFQLLAPSDDKLQVIPVEMEAL
jgi:hypothetical protein